MPAHCLLLLGSNLGKRRRLISQAIAGLSRLRDSRVLKTSRIYETAPVGPSRHRYLNAALLLKTELSPMGLLVECKRLESLAGRKNGRRWGARPLDIDIVTYGKLKMETRWLAVPHPSMAKRSFALAPLSDIAPKARLGGQTVEKLLARLNPSERTVKIYG